MFPSMARKLAFPTASICTVSRDIVNNVHAYKSFTVSALKIAKQCFLDVLVTEDSRVVGTFWTLLYIYLFLCISVTELQILQAPQTNSAYLKVKAV